MKISEKERRILSVAQYHADDSIPSLARRLNLKEHTVRYSLARLKERGVIRRLTYVNFFGLGLFEFALFFSLLNDNQRIRNKLRTVLAATSGVTWVVELGGEFHFGLGFCAKSIIQAENLLNIFTAKLGDIFLHKFLSMRIAVSYFGIKHLVSMKKIFPGITLGPTEHTITLDDLDRDILSLFCKSYDGNLNSIARALQVPLSTIEYRLRRLKEKGVLLGSILMTSATEYGMQNFRLFVYTKGISPSLGSEFLNWCRNHPHIVVCVRCLGSWDYELRVEVENASEANSLAQELAERFAHRIDKVSVIPVFAYPKHTNFPFQTLSGSPESKT